jgi:plastocyanin
MTSPVPLPAAGMAAVLLWCGALAHGAVAVPAQGAPATGRLSGVVRLTVASGGPSAATAYGRRTVAPRAKAQPEARNVVVFLADVPARADLPAMKATVEQRDEQFVPHTVAVTRGSTVAFPNRDGFFHNVFSLSRPATFDLGRYASGESRDVTFPKPGIVKVYCHIHAQMSAVIRVFDHPFFTIPEEGGTFALERIPAGAHTLVAWHERIGEHRDRVTIRPGGTTEVTFTLPVLEPEP